MSLPLHSLSDSDILTRLRELTRHERSVTVQVLLHLNEVERRKLHLKLGYSSLFDYCTRGLRYSECAAHVRIRAARCIARFPEVSRLLEAGEVSISTVSQVSKILTAENRDDILARMRRKSQREVEAIVAEYDPRSGMPGDRMRTVVVRVPLKESGGIATVATSVSTPGKVAAPETSGEVGENHLCNQSAVGTAETGPERAGQLAAPEAPASAPSATPPVLVETRKVFNFAATEAFAEKFEKIRSLAWHRLGPNPSYEQVFEVAMDCFLEKADPRARQERRRERKDVGPHEATEKVPVAARAGTSTDRSRHIAAAIRDKVFLRDGGRCTYKGPNGRRCASRQALQVDHITPVARGGESTADNLRLLCAHHNRLEAERLMGPWSRRGDRHAPGNAP